MLAKTERTFAMWGYNRRPRFPFWGLLMLLQGLRMARWRRWGGGFGGGWGRGGYGRGYGRGGYGRWGGGW